MRKTGTGILLILIGVLICGFGFYTKVKNEKFMSTAQSTSAYVTDITKETTRSRKAGRRRTRTKTTYTAHVTYKVNDVEYSTSFKSGASTLSEGDTVTIYYNPSNPMETLSSTSVNSYQGAYSAIFIIVIGIVTLIKDKRE